MKPLIVLTIVAVTALLSLETDREIETTVTGRQDLVAMLVDSDSDMPRHVK